MRRLHTALLCLLLAAIAAAGCAPPQGMVATLTMLPGTPTPRRSTPVPTATTAVTPTRARPEPEETLYTAANCPAGEYSLAAPEDPARMLGLSYNPSDLPAAFELVEQRNLDNNRHRLVAVRYQGRSVYWIDRMLCRNVAGRAHWVVVDVLDLPRLNPAAGETETQVCFAGQQPLDNAVAYGIYDPAAPAEEIPGGGMGRALNVQAAWEFSTAFSPLAAAGLRCYAAENAD